MDQFWHYCKHKKNADTHVLEKLRIWEKNYLKKNKYPTTFFTSWVHKKIFHFLLGICGANTHVHDPL